MTDEHTNKMIKITRKLIGNFAYYSNKLLQMSPAHVMDVFRLAIKDSRGSSIYNAAVRWSTRNGMTEVLALLLDAGADPSNLNELAIRTASIEGNKEIVSLLLAAGADPSKGKNQAIKTACEHGHVEIVSLLLADKRINPGANNNYAIRRATFRGHIAVVKLLLVDPRVDIVKDDNDLLQCITLYKEPHLKIVKILLKYIKHRLGITAYIKIKTEANPEAKKLWEDHLIKYRWIMKVFLEEFLTIDLLDYMNQLIKL